MSGALVLPPRLRPGSPVRAIVGALDEHARACARLSASYRALLLPAGAVRLDATPFRAVEAAIDGLGRLLAAGRLAVVGPIPMLRHGPLEQAHLELAAELRVPTLLYAGPATSPVVVAAALRRAIAVGIEPRRLAAGGIDHLAVRAVVDAGATGVLGVGQGGLSPGDVVDVVTRFDASAWPHLALGSLIHGGGATDVLSLPRAAEALLHASLPAGAAAAVSWRNAHRWLGLPASPAAFDVSGPR